MTELDYSQQLQQNEEVFRNVVRAMRPDIYSLMDAVDTNHINYIVLLRAITQLQKIATGSRFGVVSIEIQDGVCTFVRGQENERVNEGVLVQS